MENVLQITNNCLTGHLSFVCGRIMEIPGGGGSNVKPSEMENPRGWGVKLEKTLLGGYGYFLEPHTVQKWYKIFEPGLHNVLNTRTNIAKISLSFCLIGCARLAR